MPLYALVACAHSDGASPAAAAKPPEPAEYKFAADTLPVGGAFTPWRDRKENLRPRLSVQDGHRFSISAAATSGDHSVFATNGTAGQVKVWEAASGRLLQSFSLGGEGGPVALSHDGSRLVASNGTHFAVWEVETGRRILRLAMPAEPKGALQGGNSLSAFVADVAISPDGSRVAATNRDGESAVWDVLTGRVVWARVAFGPRLLSLHFSADGQTIVGAGKQGKVITADANTGKQLGVFVPGGESARPLAISGDGKHMLVGTDDGVVALYDSASGNELRKFAGMGDAPTAAAFSADGKLLVAADHLRNFAVWQTTTGKRVLTPKNVTHQINGVSFNPAATHVYSADDGGKVLRWNLSTGAAEPMIEKRAVAQVPFLSGDGAAFLAGTEHYDLMALRYGEPALDRLPPRLRAIRQIGWAKPQPLGQVHATSDGQLIIATHRSHSVGIFDGRTGALLHDLAIGAKPSGIAISEDGKFAAVAHQSSRSSRGVSEVLLFDAKTGAVLGRAPVSKNRDDGFGSGPTAMHLAFAGDGSALVGADTFGRVQGWLTTAEMKPLWTNSEVSVRCIAPIAGTGNVITCGEDSTLRLRDARTGHLVDTIVVEAEPTALDVSGDGRYAAISTFQGDFRFYDLRAKQEVLRLLPGEMGRYLFASPEGYYTTSAVAPDGVGFQLGLRGFPFDQFDLKLNRPDKVLTSYGLAPRPLVDAYHRAFLKRLRRMGVTEAAAGAVSGLPELEIVGRAPLPSTSARTIKLKVRARGDGAALSRLLVHVNDVPIDGARGRPITPAPAPGQWWQGEVDVVLSAGTNRIQLSAQSVQGDESLRQTVTTRYTGTAPKGVLHVATIGVSAYKDARWNLQYAAKDARDLASGLKARRGAHRDVRITTLTDGDATAERIKALRAGFMKTSVDDTVVLFVAGHGLISDELDYYFATADVDFDAPASRGLAYDALEGLLDGIPARQKLLLIDTCHSGEVDKEEVERTTAAPSTDGRVQTRAVGHRGLKKTNRVRLPGLGDVSRLLTELFADLRRGSGATVISASGGAEFALESDEWHNGVFTYAVLRGLEGKPTLPISALRTYVVEQVQKLTGGQQTPTSRRINLSSDFSL